MNIESVSIDQAQVHRLLSSGSGDAALLYIYLHAGNPADHAAEIGLTPSRLSCAQATLRQLGLLPQEPQRQIFSGERPNYSEGDVLQAVDAEPSFRSLYGEVQRLLGRNLNTEELKILLGFVRYLGLPEDVISVLVCYCKDRARQQGKLRNPSLRTIEKEAYVWAEQGIDTMEAAAAYIQTRNLRNSRLSRLLQQLQIRGRNLTPGEEKYANAWLDMGFDEEAIAMAYERTCLNTGGLSWAYMHKILTRWHEAGLHTAERIQSLDRKPGNAAPAGQRQMDADEQAAIARMLQEV